MSTEHTSTHIHSSVKLTEQTKSHVQLSTHISAEHQLNAIHLEVSRMLLLVMLKGIAVAQCMAVPAVFLCDFHTSHLTVAIISPHFKRAISNHDIHAMVFHFWEIDKLGYTPVVSEQNRVPFFSRRGALTHVCKTPPKRVLAPEPTTPRVRAAPQTVFSVVDPSKQRQ